MAEPQTEEGAGRKVPPQLVTRLTMDKTRYIWARGDLLRERDEGIQRVPETEKLTDKYLRTALSDQISSFAGSTGHYKFVSRIHASS